METKTSSIFEQMNYFLSSKENGVQTGTTYEQNIIPNLSLIFANQVRLGLHTEEECENFRCMLPKTSEMFDYSNLHGNCAPLQEQFVAMVQASLVEYKVAQSENEIPMGKVI